MDDFLLLGKHYVCELSGCDRELLQNNDLLEQIFVSVARENKLSIVDRGRYNFSPYGLTCYLLLEESHSSLHVWPEYGYCAVDLFTCNINLDGTAYLKALQEALGASRSLIKVVDRGAERPHAEVEKPTLVNLSYKNLPETSSSNPPWGWHLALNLYQCDPDAIRSEEVIKTFVYDLCDLIEMRRYGETIVVRFGDDPTVTGYSMFQLIETSNLAGHFAEATNSVYLDIFSCKEFNPDVAIDFCTKTFKSAQAHGGFIKRG